MKTFVFAFFVALLSVSTSANAATVSGTILDAQTGQPVGYASIQVLGTGRSMIANETGQYRLRLNDGRYNLKFSHIGYLSDEQQINLVDSLTLDIALVPTAIVIKGIKAYDRTLDPGQRIIVEAIKRKKDILSKIKTYSFDAYSRVSLTKPDKKAEDSTEIFLIAESQTSGFWESPNKYKEIIKSRRQTANIPAEGNLLAIGEIINFNLNRIELEKYSVVSPTAEDALEYYNYYLLDTIYIDNKPVFHLEFEPRSQAIPLFAGFIDIADSTYDVVGVSVTFNKALDFPMFIEPWYSQRFAKFDPDIWMPVEERINGQINIPFPGFPILTIDYLASIYDYRFNIEHPKGTFDEYILEVDKMADEVDSVAWFAAPTIPLSPKEIQAYTRIDSTENAPKPFYYYPLYALAGTYFILTEGYDFVHYNRVEGAYAGLGIKTDKLLPGLDIHAKSGYAFELERWRHNYGFEYELNRKKRIKIGFEYHDEIRHRPTIFTHPDFNPTFLALLAEIDPFDYYLEKGFKVHAGIRPIRQLELEIDYRDFKQYTVGVNTDYSLFGTEPARPNPPIVEGRLRAVGGELTWDSRPLINNKGQEFRATQLPYIIFRTGVEYSSPDVIESDFSYRRHYVSINSHYRFLGLGTSELHLYGGIADGILPPQNLFTVDFAGELMPENVSFKTLGRNNFSGNQVFSAYLDHDFGRFLFLKSGLPGFKDLPFSLGVHGGLFWTDLKGDNYSINRDHSRLAKTAFSELGFAVGRIPPLSAKLYFTWQLSGYTGDDIEKLSIDFNIEF
jgi:hypothetical protein